MNAGMASALGGLTAQLQKLAVSANNTANANTDGFKKSRVIFEEGQAQGVQARIEQINSPGPLVNEVTAQGEELVEKSNVDLVEEITSLITVKHGLAANIETIKAEDKMLGTLLDIKA